jgi:hypothetical protein
VLLEAIAKRAIYRRRRRGRSRERISFLLDKAHDRAELKVLDRSLAPFRLFRNSERLVF